jgi:hypothetical protein
MYLDKFRDLFTVSESLHKDAPETDMLYEEFSG